MAALRNASATSITEAARKHGVSAPSLHRWRKQFADMEVSDVRELKCVKEENARGVPPEL